MVFSLSISSAFDGGNIKYVAQRQNKNDPTILDVIVHIQPDLYTELEQIAHMQYFSFRVSICGLEGEEDNNNTENGNIRIQKVRYIIQNAHAVSYPEAWSGSTIFYSNDLDNVDSWERNQSTFYKDGKLTWEQDHTRNGTTYFSYFPPYSYGRHLKFLSECIAHGKNNSRYMTLGQSLDGREIDCISVGQGSTVCWIIHRQHPGESMAEHYAEGLLTRLLQLKEEEEEDTIIQDILQLYTFYIVPCMCPDGVVRGHLRTNASGANLNREWANKPSAYYEAPTLERSPEVFCVLQKMDDTGCDIFLDIHGDEELPYNFISGANNIPHWSTRLEALHGAFTAEYTRATSGIMQQRIGYPPQDTPEEVLEYMNVATNQVSNRFQCLGMTLEMPFKDCLSQPDPQYGWNPKKSRDLGAAVLKPLQYIHPFLRQDEATEFWKEFPSEDAYVATTDDYQNIVYNVISEGEEGEEGSSEAQQPFIMLKKRVYSDVHEIHKRDPHLN